jgi:hypothetical protein
MAEESIPENIMDPLQPRITRDEDWWADPNTPRGQERQTARDQRGLVENVQAGFADTALSDVLTLVQEEGIPLVEEKGLPVEDRHPITQVNNIMTNIGLAGLGVLGWRAGEEEDYSEQYEQLTTGIPSQYHEEILDEPNAAAAARARARIQNQLERARVAGAQQGLSANLAMIAGGIVDLDAPLMLMTGGGYKAADMSRRALQIGKRTGLSPKAALRGSSAAVGASAGLQAGLVVGTGQAALRETADWTVVGEVALQSMLLGTAANPVLGGDIQMGVKAAQEELYSRVARDDPSLNEYPEVHPSAAERIDPFVMTSAEDGSTVGAAQAAIPQTPLDGNVSDNVKAWGAAADEWRHTSDWQGRKVAEDNEWWARVAQTGMFNVTTGNFRRLYQSESSVMNWLLGNVYESPNGLGRGRYTAAAGNEFYHRRITEKFVQDTEIAVKDYAKRHGMLSAGVLPSADAVRQFNREVMLEMNDRLHGRTPTSPRDPAVIKAADAYDRAGAESVRIGKGAADEPSIDGFEAMTERAGYSPYVWDGRAVRRLENAGIVTRKDLIDAMEVAYRRAGMQNTKDARAVAEAVVQRAVAESDEIDTSLVALLSGDGREWLNQSLERNGMSAPEREALMQRLTGKVEERGQEGFTKSRNDIDLSVPIKTSDGSTLQVADLMDQDLHGVWQKYARRMAGASALARVGITNRAQREQIIQAAQAQQRALGEEVVEADLLRAMFSHFDGGPVHGYGKIFGYDEGVAPVAALVKRMTNLSLLGKLGFAQAAETGAAIAAVGFESWMRRGIMANFQKELRSGNTELLGDMAFITGELGKDHKMFSEHLDIDDMNASDRGELMQRMQGVSQKATYVQSMLSGFNSTRGWQQRVATAAMTDKIFRTLKNNADDDKFRRRMWSDLGLDTADLNRLYDLIDDGVIEFKTHGGYTFVNRINADQWPADLQLSFGAAITRNMNQVVQKSMAGEQDAWLHTTVGSIMTHLKTFPMQAMQKQFIRNARHSDVQTLNTVLMGMATAGLAIIVRDAIDGKERSLLDTAKTAFGYSNLTGWVPMVYDPTMTLLGLEDMRINQYGPHSDYTPATVTFLNRASRLPGAAVDTLTGDADYYDRQAMKALPFSNLVGLSRITD